MSKYDDFVTNLKEEVSNMEVVDRKKQIKTTYLEQEEAKPKKKIVFGRLSYAIGFTFVLLIAIVIIVSSNSNKPAPIIKPEKPVIASTVDESYAFELMAAANQLYLSNTENVSLMRFMKLKTNNINEACENIHNHYLTIRQLLNKSKVDFEIKTSSKEGYDYQMIINPYLNDGLSLQYTMYFNKTLKEIDDDEEVYDLNGIIIINNIAYTIIGETEKEEDEVETTIKVILDNNHYFIIEQEKEEDEYEYVYTEYLNNNKIAQYELSYEIEDNEIEVVIEIDSQDTKGKIKAKQKNNKLELKVEFDYYNGNVQVNDDGTSVEYFFKDENQTIKYEIIKKNINFTNKNDILFVY